MPLSMQSELLKAITIHIIQATQAMHRSTLEPFSPFSFRSTVQAMQNHTPFPSQSSLLHLHSSFPFIISIHHFHPSFPSIISILHLHLYFINLLGQTLGRKVWTRRIGMRGSLGCSGVRRVMSSFFGVMLTDL